MLTNTIGFLASCIAFIMFIPSAVTIYKNRHDAHALRGSSIGMNLLLVTNALLWGAYGFLSSAFWVAAPGLVNLPLAVFSIYAIVRSRQQESVKSRCGTMTIKYSSLHHRDMVLLSPPIIPISSMASCLRLMKNYARFA